MSEKQLRQRRDAVIAAHGPWTAHSIHLGDSVYTLDHPHNDPRLRRFLQVASDIVAKPLDTVRVLDLACLEGLHSVEFALNGAKVVGVEGREANLAKARFTKDALSLGNLPSPDTKRWVPRRKAEVVAAVHGGLISLEEACARYALTVEEFESWEYAISRYGLNGLRATRAQSHRVH